jgi:hypothetical protein
VAAARIFDPSATSVLSTPPVAVAAEGTTTVQYTAPTSGTYYIDIMYTCNVAMGYTFMVFVQPGSGSYDPDVTFEPDVVSLVASVGAPPPASQTVTITIAGSFPSVSWSLFNVPDWLTITPDFGTAPGITAMNISVDTSGLASGSYETSIEVAVDVPSGPGNLRRLAWFSSAELPPASYGTLPVHLVVSEDGTAKLDCEIASLSVSPASPRRRSRTTPRTLISGGLRAWGGLVETESVLASQPVGIWRSYDNVTFSKIATAVTNANGDFSYSAAVAKKTFFFMRFEGNDQLESTHSEVKSCLPFAYLTTPVVPRSVRKARSFSTYGYVYPAHSSTYPVKVYFYHRVRLSSGKYRYVRKKTVKGKRVARSGSRVKYRAVTKVRQKGKWKVKVVHADSDHKKSYSSWRSFSVK